MKKLLKKNKELKLYHYINDEKLEGAHTDLVGDCSNLQGDCSDLQGNCTKISGDLDICEISDEDRMSGIEISTLLEE